MISTLVMFVSERVALGAEHGASSVPLLDRLAGEPLPVGKLGGAVRKHLVRADRAATSSHPFEAVEHLNRAIAELPESAPACTVRGTIHYLSGLLISLAGQGPVEGLWGELRQCCIRADVPEEEDQARIFLSAMIGALNLAVPKEALLSGNHGGTEEKPADGFERAARALTGTRAMILKALASYERALGTSRKSVCDEQFEPRLVALLAGSYTELDGLGRPDLGRAYWRYSIFDPDGSLEPEGIRNLTRWAKDEANAWLRMGILAEALTAISQRVEWADPVMTAELCGLFYAQLEQQVASDRRPGFVERDVRRAMSALQFERTCNAQEDARRIVDDAMSASIDGEEGGIGFIEAAAGMLGQALMEAMQGQSNSLPLVLDCMKTGIKEMRARLGNTPDEKALAALLDLALPAGEAIMGLLPVVLGSGNLDLDGELGERLEMLERALVSGAETFSELAVLAVDEETSVLLRLAPVFRTGSHGVLALIRLLHDDVEGARKEMEVVEHHAQEDLSGLLLWLEQPDVSQTLVRMVRSGIKLGKTLSADGATDWRSVVAIIDEATGPDDNETQWWKFGLDVARLVAWDALALAAILEDSPETMTEALKRGAETCRVAVDQLLSLTEVHPLAEAFLHMLPGMHSEIPGWVSKVSEKEDQDEAIVYILESLEPHFRTGIDRLYETELAEVPEIVFVLDLFKDALDIGVQGFVADPTKALGLLEGVLADKLANANNMADGPRMMLHSLHGVVSNFSETGNAHEAFVRASDAARQGLPWVAFLPTMLELSFARQAESPQEIMAPLMDEIAEFGKEALSCGKAHAVHALLPTQTWSLEVQGNHEAAEKKYREFKSLVERGFSGDAVLYVSFLERSGGAMLQGQISHTVNGLLLHDQEEGTMKLGGGWSAGGSDDGGNSYFAIDAKPVPSPRLDRIMQAHLAFAVYSMLNHESRDAHEALSSALNAARRMFQASTVTLGPVQGGALMESTRKLGLADLAWTSTLARLCGHVEAANQLELMGRQLASARAENWPGGGNPPPLLKDLAKLEGFGKIVHNWAAAGTSQDADSTIRDVRRWNRKNGIAPEWGIALADEVLRRQVQASRGAIATKARPGKDAAGEGVLAVRRLLAEAEDGVPERLKERFVHAVEKLASAGWHEEVAGSAGSLSSMVARHGRKELALEIIDVCRQWLTAETAPVIWGQLVIQNIQMRWSFGKEMLSLEDFKRAVDLSAGYGWWKEELNIRIQLFELLVRCGHLEEAEKRARQLLPMLARYSGPQTGFYNELLVQRTALLGATCGVETGFVEYLAGRSEFLPISEAYRTYLAALEAAPTEKSRKSLSLQFLEGLFPPNQCVAGQ